MKKKSMVSLYLYLVPILILVFAALPTSGLCSGDHGGTCATADKISVPSITPGIGETVSDRDYFKFLAPAYGKLYVYTTGADANTTGYFGSSCDLWLVRDYNHSGSGGNFLLSYDNVRAGIWYYVAVEDNWHNGYQLHVLYDSSVQLPEITNPTPGSTLSGSTVTFNWDANDYNVDFFFLYVGTSPGASDIYLSSWFTTNTSEMVNGLPTDGSTVYVRLLYFTPEAALPYPYVDAQYTAYSSGTAGCTLPVGHLDYCLKCGPCVEGEGDCDSDSECESGLTCVQVTGTDYCQSGPCQLPVGHLDYCRDCGPCAEGQGDCDNNSECQSGLTCVQVTGTDYCQSDGCPHPVGHLDYCRDCGPCAEGQGDCDNDNECQSGLTCVQVPGTDTCQSSGCPHPVGHLDYCRDCGPCTAGEGDCDNDGECQSGLACVQVPGTDVCCPHPIGHLDYCRDCGPCAAGQGDCDNDGECQSGLTCVQVTGTDTCQ